MITGIPPTKFFETFLELSRQKGLSASIAVEEAGLHRSAVTNWRRGKLPGEKALSKLTAYFGVTRQYLLEGAPTEAGSNDVDKTAPSVDIESEPTTFDLDFQENIKVQPLSAKRSFINLAIHFLKYRYPEETTESLVAKLGMVPEAYNVLNNDQVDTIPIAGDWDNKFYSLLDHPDYLSFLSDLNDIHLKLVRERRKANTNQAIKAIGSYLYQQKIPKFEFGSPWINPEYGVFASTVYLTEKCEQWLFLYFDCSKEYFHRDYMKRMRCFKDSIYFVSHTLSVVTRYYFMFTYTTGNGINGDFSVIEKMVTEEYKNIMARFQHVQFWLFQIDGSTGEITKKGLLNTPVMSSSKGTDESAPEEIGGQ